jgi:hypothetical protein
MLLLVVVDFVIRREPRGRERPLDLDAKRIGVPQGVKRRRVNRVGSAGG